MNLLVKVCKTNLKGVKPDADLRRKSFFKEKSSQVTQKSSHDFDFFEKNKKSQSHDFDFFKGRLENTFRRFF
jgi:hypothetical protein